MEGKVMIEIVNATILNVDKNEPTRITTTRNLIHAGCEVWQAGTGTQALFMAKAKPDLIVLDTDLPDFNGFEVCLRLKAEPVGTRLRGSRAEDRPLHYQNLITKN